MKYIALLFLLLLPISVSAHVLRIDRTIGVTVHIEPDDEPVAKQIASIFIDISDNTNRFTASECDCWLKISHLGTEVAAIPVTNQDGYTNIDFGFQEYGAYDLVVSGLSKTNNFQSFIATFAYYVKPNGEAGKVSTTANPLQRDLPYIIVTIGLLIIGMFLGPPLWTQKGKE